MNIDKQTYEEVAKQLERETGYKFNVVDTSKVDEKFCDKYSIYITSEVNERIYRAKDSKVVSSLFDGTFLVKNKEYYIEPYNTKLYNLALL